MEDPSIEQVFSYFYHPSLSLIIDYLPHIQWPKLRQINQYSKGVVEERLGQLKIFSHPFKQRNIVVNRVEKESDPQEQFEYFRRIYIGLRDITPNLIELPFPVGSILTLGGFPNLRKVTLFWGHLDEKSGADIDTMVKEITSRAPILKSMKFGLRKIICSDTATVELNQLTDGILQSGYCFPEMKKLELGLLWVDQASFPIDFASNFPLLEELSLPTYLECDPRPDFENIKPLMKLRHLEIGIQSMRTNSNIPSIPQIETMVFTDLVGNTNYEYLTEFFAGAESLRELQFGVHSTVSTFFMDPKLVEIVAAIPSYLEKLSVYSLLPFTTDEFAKLMESDCLNRLTSLKIRLGTSSLMTVIGAINRQLTTLKDLEIIAYTINHERNLEFQNTHRLNFELPNLERLTIKIILLDCDGETIIFEPSRSLKRTLRIFKLLVTYIVGSEENFILHTKSLLDEFLRDCEVLEQFWLIGWSDSKTKAVKEGLMELQLPNLREIKTNY